MNVPSEISNTLYPCFMRYFAAATCKCVLPRPKLLCSRFACARLDGSNCLIRSSPNVAIKPKLFCFVPLISSNYANILRSCHTITFVFLSLVGTNQISLVQTLLESLHSATFVRSLVALYTNNPSAPIPSFQIHSLPRKTGLPYPGMLRTYTRLM